MFIKNQKNKGFTLLEILIALAIFAIISLILSSALHNILGNQSRVEEHNQEFTQLQLTLLLLSRDIEQSVNRPIINSFGLEENAFLGNSQQITFTHTGYNNPNNQERRSTLQRSRYRFENGMLIRETWPVLDQSPHTQPVKRILLKHISDLRFSFLNQEGRFEKLWPSANDKQKTPLPRAVKIYLSVKKWGNITQLYLIPVEPAEQTGNKPNEKPNENPQ